MPRGLAFLTLAPRGLAFLTLAPRGLAFLMLAPRGLAFLTLAPRGLAFLTLAPRGLAFLTLAPRGLASPRSTEMTVAWKVLKSLAILSVCAWLAGAGLLFVFQRSFMYFPDTTRRSPAAANFAKASAIVLTTADRESIVAWYAPAHDDKPLFLFMHGNGGSLASVSRLFSALTSDGSGLLVVDYRGYGGSSGRPTEQGLILDGEAALAKVAALGYPPERIVLIGQSLGTGVAVMLAARHKVAALILDAPYSATVDVAASRYWMFPVRLLMTDTFRSDQRIRDVHVPLLVMHGDDDNVIPIAFGERLFTLAHDPKLFLRVDGGHMVLSEPHMIGRMRTWLKTALPHPSPS